MSSNLYERVVQWDSKELRDLNQDDYEGNQGGQILSTTLDSAYGVDVDNQIINAREITGSPGKYTERQTLDYDVFRTARAGVGSQATDESFDESWLNQINRQDNYIKGENVTRDRGGFLNMDGSASMGGDYAGTWDQGEITSITDEYVRNGRMHDIRNEDKLFREDLTSEYKLSKDDQITSVKGIVESTALSEYFFSDMNKQQLQEGLKARVWKNTGKFIGDQSENELFIVMRSIMLQFANFSVNGMENLKNEIQELNMKVLDYCVEIVSSNVLQHDGYMSDLERIPLMDRPVSMYNSRGYAFDLSSIHR